MRPVLLLAALAALAGSCGAASSEGGSKACTTIGCVDGLTVNFSQPLRSPGAYVVNLETPSGKVKCEATLPFSGCNTSSPCSTPDVQLFLSGCALPADQHAITGFQISRAFPESVKLSVTRDSTPVIDTTFPVAYATSMPNGPDCEPVCKQASTSVPVSSP